MLKLNRHGDTIIEVMIALAILGLAFATAYATANSSLEHTRNSQEHAEALQYLASQAELLRADERDSQIYKDTNPFCMNASTDQRVDGSCAAIAPIGYITKITYNNDCPVDTFTLDVNWTGVGSLGPQHEQMQYKVHRGSYAC